MSLNRENVTWQSPRDLKWRNAHYEVIEGDTSDPDYDYEWDVEYDTSRFWWVGPPRGTWEQAVNTYHGANPGGTTVVDNPKQAAVYDRMADELKARQTDKSMRAGRWL